MKILVAAICLSAISTGAIARDLSDSEKAVIVRSVIQNFRNPMAAKFQWAPLPDTWSNIGETADGKMSGSQFYCSMVNGKRNSFGVYAGFTPFLTKLVAKDGQVVSSSLVAVGAPGELRKESAIYSRCGTYGLNPRQATQPR